MASLSLDERIRDTISYGQNISKPRFYNVLRSNEKHIKNIGNCLYGTMQNLFGIWWNKQAARDYAAKSLKILITIMLGIKDFYKLISGALI